MNTPNFIILLITLVYTSTLIGQEEYRLENPMKVRIQWKPLVGDFKKLQVEIKKYKAAKKELVTNNRINYKHQKLNITSDTTYFKDYNSLKHGQYNVVKKTFIPSDTLIASPFIFKDNATKNITYQDVAHGFFTNSTRSIAQDKDGYIWIGSTDNGLCKYDGFHYEIFSISSNLQSNHIRDIAFDSKGILWIATDLGISYVLNDEVFVIDIPGIEVPKITELYIDKDDNVWFGAENQGLVKIDKTEFTIYDTTNILPTNTTYGMFHDEHDNHWVGLSDQYGFLKFDNERIIRYQIQNGVAQVIASHFFEDENGIWIGMFEGGLIQYKNNSFWRHDFLKSGYDNIYSIKKNNKGLWFNIYGGGIANFNGTNTDFFNVDNGLNGYATFEAFVDTQQNVWATDLGHGISRLNENLFSSDNRHTSVPNITIDSKGDKWFCSNGGTFKKETKAGKTYEISIQTEGDFPVGNYIWDLGFQSNGIGWGATYSAGCFRFTEQEFLLHSFPELNQVGNVLYAVEVDKDDKLWFTSRENGLIHYNGKDFTLINKSNGLISNKLNQLFLDSKDRLWVASEHDGVNLIKDAQVATLSALSNKNITNFFEDQQGNIWIGTANHGVYILRGENLYNINKGNGLITDAIKSIIQDQNKRYWIATSKGITTLKFDAVNTYTTRTFGVEYGNFLVDFSGAVALNEDGSIIWGANNNIINYDPLNERLELKAPKLILKNFSTSNNDLNDITPDLPIKVTPEGQLTLNYTALDWGYEDQIEFEYALLKKKDSIQEWINIQRNTQLKLKNIPSGKYHLYLKAKGINGEAISPKIRIHFLPFWWETIWFKIALVFLVMVSFLIVFKLRTKRLLKKQIKLEKAVQDKTLIIEEEKERLKIKNKLIAGQKQEIETLLEEVNHRVKNNLTMLSSLLYLQERQLKNPEAKSALQDGINRIKSISIIHEKLHNYDNHTKISFQDYCTDLIKSIEGSLAPQDKSIKIEVNCVDHIRINVTKSVYLALIINELITNSYKYAFHDQKEGVIGIELGLTPDNKNELKIYDNGIGLQQNWEHNSLHSIGLKLVKMLAKEIESEITYNHNNFSTFTLIF